MPSRSYNDTNNATIFSIIIISFIFGVIFTVDYYKEENKLVKDKFSNFTGHLNIETIGKYIIECHLRFGDIDFCNNDIILLALLNLNHQLVVWLN